MLSADLSARRYCGRSAIVVLVLEALVQAPWVLLGWLFQDLGTQVGVRQSVSESVRISIIVSDLRVSLGYRAARSERRWLMPKLFVKT